MLEYFPDPYPDEILYSVWARYSEQVRYSARYAVFEELFGNNNATTVIDLPCHLEYFFDHLPTGHAYTIDDFINDYTLFPYYSSFLSKERRKVIRTHMITGKGDMIHRLAGIAANSIPRPMFLRYCPLCLEEDRKCFGEYYWHRLHQVPGVEVCPVHEVFLENSPFPAIGPLKARFQFISAESISKPTTPRRANRSPYAQILLNIAQDSDYLLKNAYIVWENDMLVKRYACLLSSQKFLTREGLVRKLDLLEAFRNHYNPELLALLHCELGRVRNVRQNWPAELVTLSTTKGSNHPLLHILVIHFLNSTVENFSLHQPQEEPKYLSAFGHGPWPCLNPICKYYQQAHILTYEISKHSEAKRSKHPIAIFSCSCGFTYTRSGRSSDNRIKRDRIISYGSAWETKLQDLWLDPTVSLRSTSRQLGVTIDRLYRQAARLQLPVPRMSPHLLNKNVNLRYPPNKGDRLAYRERWLILIQEFPEVGVSSLRKIEVHTYNWLHKYDKEWLIEHQPARKFIQKSHVHKLFLPDKQISSRENDVNKDIAASNAIKDAFKLLICQEPPKRITRKSITLLVPYVALLRKKPHKAPLTMKELYEAIETIEDFTIRRIKWTAQKYREEGFSPSRRAFVRKLNLDHYLHLSTVKKALDEAMIAML